MYPVNAESTEFKKYVELGAYHWSATYAVPPWRSSPRMHALYDLALDCVERKAGVPLRNLAGLDVGCGDGVLIYKIMLRAGRVVGLDLTLAGLTLARQEIAVRTQEAPCLIAGSSYRLPLLNATVDFVVSTETIEHLAHPQEYLDEIVRVLKPGGVFICTTPRRRSEYVQDPYHVREYSAEDLNFVLSSVFTKVEVLGIYPVWLDRVYMLRCPRLFGRGIRFVIKIMARWYNPFRNFVLSSPYANQPCDKLIGMGCKPAV